MPENNANFQQADFQETVSANNVTFIQTEEPRPWELSQHLCSVPYILNRHMLDDAVKYLYKAILDALEELILRTSLNRSSTKTLSKRSSKRSLYYFTPCRNPSP